MRALHWLRSRMEENELGYWLSFVAYDQKDRSLINKAYLLYLAIFFFIWFMMVFFFFAEIGGMALSFLNPEYPANTAVVIEWFVLIIWNLFSLIKSTRKSPIMFSETDQVLVCQTPVSRRALVMRWLWMPWFKNALLFWIMALVLGFSVAELHFASTDFANAFFSYVGFGIRAMVQIMPVHLAFYTFQWIVGVMRLHKNDQRNWILFPAIAVVLIPLGFLLFNNSLLEKFNMSLLFLFINPQYISGEASASLIAGICAALLALVILFSVSRHFNLNRAAQETSELELLTTASKYGFTDLVEQRRLQNRLTSNKQIPLPARHKGSAALAWRNRIQSKRGWDWKQPLPLVTVFSIMLGLPLIPGFISKLLALFFLVLQIGPIMTQRLRSELACWPILQQLPLFKQQILIRDLSSKLPYFLAAGLLGLLVPSIFTKTIDLNYLLIFPGILATIALTAAIDIFRKSKSDLLINGNVPSVGTQGVLLGMIGTAIPVWVASTFLGLPGVFFSTVISFSITWVCYKFSVISFKNIKS